jgi:hypothetical protein
MIGPTDDLKGVECTVVEYSAAVPTLHMVWAAPGSTMQLGASCRGAGCWLRTLASSCLIARMPPARGFTGSYANVAAFLAREETTVISDVRGPTSTRPCDHIACVAIGGDEIS